jgi:hypothetical protein
MGGEMSAWPVGDAPRDATALARRFEQVDRRYGPVPIRWWSGGRPDRERLRWQMEQPGDSVLLDLGDVRGAAEVRVNNAPAGTLPWSPYRAGISGYLSPGTNDLEVIVRGTLAGYLDSASLTPAVTRGQARRGLFGPVTVIFHSRS